VVEDIRGHGVVEDIRGHGVVEDIRGHGVVEDIREWRRGMDMGEGKVREDWWWMDGKHLFLREVARDGAGQEGGERAQRVQVGLRAKNGDAANTCLFTSQMQNGSRHMLRHAPGPSFM
jgi:hypothetical protein